MITVFQQGRLLDKMSQALLLPGASMNDQSSLRAHGTPANVGRRTEAFGGFTYPG